MANTAQEHDPLPDDPVEEQRPAVQLATAATPDPGEPQPALGRGAAIGATVGFTAVFSAVSIAAGIGGWGLGSSLGVGAFVGAWGGAGFGAMTGAIVPLIRYLDARPARPVATALAPRVVAPLTAD